MTTPTSRRTTPTSPRTSPSRPTRPRTSRRTSRSRPPPARPTSRRPTPRSRRAARSSTSESADSWRLPGTWCRGVSTFSAVRTCAHLPGPSSRLEDPAHQHGQPTGFGDEPPAQADRHLLVRRGEEIPFEISPLVDCELVPKSSIELDGHALGDVLNVAKACSASLRERPLSLRTRQTVRTLDSRQVAVLQHGVGPGGHVVEDGGQEGSPSQTALLENRVAKAMRCGQSLLAQVRQHADRSRFVRRGESSRGRLECRIFKSESRRCEVPEGASVQVRNAKDTHTLRRTNPASRVDRDSDGRRGDDPSAVCDQRRLPRQHGRPGVEHRRHPQLFGSRSAGVVDVDAGVDGFPLVATDHPLDQVVVAWASST